MTEGEALLKDPDDGPRVVYADCLEEQGEQELAAFRLRGAVVTTTALLAFGAGHFPSRAVYAEGGFP